MRYRDLMIETKPSPNLVEARSRRFYDPSAIWLHGGPSVLDGGALKRYGKSHGDMGALFFCKDIPVGRWYTATYAGSQGTVWQVRLTAKADAVFDLSNPRHRERLRKGVSPEEYNSFITSSSDGYMDWASVDDEMFEAIGFRGCVFRERPAGMATGLPPQYGMTTLPEPVLSVGMFHASDVQIIGAVPSEHVWDFFR